MAVQEILNFIEIDGKTASGGQPSEMQLREASAAGYDLVINLAPHGLPRSLPGEDALLHGLGVEYRHIPVDWTNPTPGQLDEFIAVMEQAEHRRKLIHCQANLRATAFYSLYAMARLGWDRQRADDFRNLVWNTQPGFAMNDIWQKFVEEASIRIDLTAS